MRFWNWLVSLFSRKPEPEPESKWERPNIINAPPGYIGSKQWAKDKDRGYK